MKVRTLINKKDEWDQEYPDDGEYVVYAMEIYNDQESDLIQKGNIIYIIDTNIGLRWYNSQYFDIIDSRISRFWNFYIGNWFCELWADIWIWNAEFQSKIMYDDDKESTKLFQSYKISMELEFSDPNLKNTIIVDWKWIQCIECQNIWENRSDLSQVICPNCSSKMNNQHSKF